MNEFSKVYVWSMQYSFKKKDKDMALVEINSDSITVTLTALKMWFQNGIAY